MSAVPVTPEPAGVQVGAIGPAAILQSVRTIIATPEGSVPLDRDFGCTWSLIDQPAPRAVALLTGEIITKIRKYEPRARVTFIGWDQTDDEAGDGVLKPIVYVEILQ
jgi:uncharacterized protein